MAVADGRVAVVGKHIGIWGLVECPRCGCAQGQYVSGVQQEAWECWFCGVRVLRVAPPDPDLDNFAAYASSYLATWGGM